MDAFTPVLVHTLGDLAPDALAPDGKVHLAYEPQPPTASGQPATIQSIACSGTARRSCRLGGDALAPRIAAVRRPIRRAHAAGGRAGPPWLWLDVVVDSPDAVARAATPTS